MPIYPPTIVNGVERPNQRKNKRTKVENGTATLDWDNQIRKFKIKNTEKTKPGKIRAVPNTTLLIKIPPRDLYSLADEYPAIVLVKTQNATILLNKAPRLAGDRKPNNAKSNVMTAIARTCAPLPTRIHNTEE